MRTKSSYTQQSAAIPVRAGRVCLITSRRNSKRWVIPKGHLEPGKTPDEVALQEAWEEAGLTGSIHGESVGSYTYEKAGCHYRVTVFLMQVTDAAQEWPEKHQRTRRWLDVRRALGRVDEPGLRELLRNVQPAIPLAV